MVQDRFMQDDPQPRSGAAQPPLALHPHGDPAGGLPLGRR
jgi:hypothetical protein